MTRKIPALLTTPVLVAGAVLLMAAAPAQRKHKRAAHPYGNANAISVHELKTYDYFLASDQLEGRDTPSRGYDLAALYVASHLSQWGLEPGGSTTGTNGPLQPYFLPMDLVTTNPNPAAMRLAITVPAVSGGRFFQFFGMPAPLPAGTHRLAYGHDWIVNTPTGRNAPQLTGGSFQNAQLVFAGNGYVIGGHNPYDGLDVQGKVLVVAGEPTALRQYQTDLINSFLHGAARPKNPMSGGAMTPEQYAAAHGAVAVISAPSFNELSEMAKPDAGKLHFGVNGPNYQVVKFLPPPAPAVPQLVAGPALMNALFQGEKVSASAVMAEANSGTLPSFALAPDKTISGTVAVTTTHNHAEDVIGMLPGSDPVLKDQYVVISAHLDHIGLSPTPGCREENPILAAGDSTDFGLTMAPDQKDCDGINNGADDDGSGSTALLGVAHAFVTGAAKGMRPKRTIIFLWNTGEEKGLWGSQYFAEFPPVDIHHVVADLNMDMEGRARTPGYVDPPHEKLVAPNEVFVIGPEVSSSEMGQTLDRVNDGFQKMDLNHFYDDTVPDATHDNIGPGPQGQRVFYRSDHYNFAKLGIPIVFFTTGLHPDYHRVTDSPDKLNFPNMQKIARTVAALGWVLGTEPDSALPKLDAQLPPLLVHDMAVAKKAGWGELTPASPPLPGEPF
ncbi:MAG: M28 family peptidase [Terriglobales bacterium]